MGKSGSGKRRAMCPTCTRLEKVLCAAMFGNDSAVSAGLIQGPIFLLHPGALFFFRPAKKEEGADPFPLLRPREKEMGGAFGPLKNKANLEYAAIDRS